MRVLLATLAVLAASYLAVALLVYFQQRTLLYRRNAQRTAPAEAGLVNVENHEIATPDGERLVVWWSPPQRGRPTVLYFHGNAGTLADRTERFAFYQAQGFGVLFVSWRGYGGSTGSPSEQGLLTDAGTAYDWLVSQGVASASICVVGESLGSGPATALATTKPVAALALEAPYSSMVETATFHYPWLPVSLMLHDRYESAARIGGLKAPLLVVHGTADQVVPYALGKKLYEAAPEPKRMITVDGADHMDVFSPPTWAEEAKLFLSAAR
ncbi:MAG: alpha/beta hydrolase [Hyphomicrobiales bacterium]